MQILESINVFLDIQLPTHAIIIAIFLCFLFLVFFIFYICPASLLWFRLWQLRKRLEAFKQSNRLEYPAELFNRGKILSHLWAEYKQTLHEQRFINPQTSIEELAAIRSTIPAEAIFSPTVLVDSQLHAEFFKHLPGILTGMGIIGTFLGLIQGLHAFQISENTEVVRKSLKSLLDGVHEAFLVSLTAIGLAMLITAIEKWLFSCLYRRVEELCFLIDSLYESGAGEEYLARLVKASEESTSQAKIIKDALVGELKEILREVTQQQIQSTLSSQQQLGEQFKESIQAGISQPLQEIASRLNERGEKTGRDLSKALDDVFAAFTEKLQNLFGSQTVGIYELQQKTIEALQSTVQQFQQMTRNIDAAGRQTTDAMAKTLTETMEAMKSHQQAAAEAVRSIHIAVARMSEVTTAALADLNQGAGTVLTAAHEFGRAGQSVAGVFERSTGVAKELSAAADAVSASTRAMGTIVDDHRRVRQELSQMIEALKNTVASARKEASLTADILTRIDSATQKLAAAQNQADHYLGQVSEVLKQTHQEFASNMRNTLSAANQQFFQHLSDATSLLRESIGELDAVLGGIGSNSPGRK